ncbi:hypothetical protein [Legionella oakridgensis]|uniref:Uncharacterized protein n=2 Tax=Legionella oakridgensis TaxID=29423 RepID=W0B8T3_9GAMM|nr:hypothetical protein [Legionella oakridgensis]AHE66948.1 hypothetical protein Loa_01395 [Legionella oakridgensis ATCC 33761 = DSM 21215]ETO93403.1 hypothetical protein LOR_60c14240 [Legionella oakridgensis RV-2-2007]KTD39516.1 hypothetical protein Loak_0942 [Legionella oakridgensis]STY20054.1 Uncharacterised protein [Legionella longbeachae]
MFRAPRVVETVHKVKQFAGHKISEALHLDIHRGFVTMPVVSPIVPRVEIAVPPVATSKAVHRILVGGMSVQASVLAQAQKKPEIVGKTTVVSSLTWLQKLHPDWYEKPWGQPKRYLPDVSRGIADVLFPHYPDDKLMTFGMMKAIEEEQRKQLKGLGIPLIEDIVHRIVGGVDGVAIHCSDEVIKIATGTDYQVVHTGRVPIGPEGIPVQHFGDAYSVSKKDSQIPRVVIGSGLNLDWACRDMHHLSPIIHLIPPGDRARPELADKLHAAIQLEDAQLEFLDEEDVRILAKDVFRGRTIDMRVMTSQLFSAMGFKLDRTLVVTDDPSRVQYVDTAPSPDAIKVFISSTGVETVKAMDLRGTVVPNGNMMLNFLKIQHELGHFALDEKNAMLLTTAWEDAIAKKAAAAGVQIQPEFFRNIEDRVKHSFEKFIPSEVQIWRVIRNAYEKGVSFFDDDGVVRSRPMAVDSKGKPMEWEDFKKLITSPTEDVMRAAHIMEDAPDESAKFTHS